jgi:hypothetical protein
VRHAPAAHAFAVKLELCGELIQAASDPSLRGRVAGELGVPSVAEQRSGVELALAHQRFRALPGPARGLVREQPERMDGRRGTPEPPEHAGGDAVRLLLVGDLPKRRARLASLQEQRAPFGVVREQADGSVSIPVGERVRLVLALGLGEVDLENGPRAVRHTHRRDVGDVAWLKGRLEVERPALGALRDEPREPLEPGGAPRLFSPPFQPLWDRQTAMPGRTRRFGRSSFASFTLGLSGSASGGAP